MIQAHIKLDKLIDTKQVGYIMEEQWYLAHDDSPIKEPYMWMPIPILPTE
jgi:hypothetical protein